MIVLQKCAQLYILFIIFYLYKFLKLIIFFKHYIMPLYWCFIIELTIKYVGIFSLIYF